MVLYLSKVTNFRDTFACIPKNAKMMLMKPEDREKANHSNDATTVFAMMGKINKTYDASLMESGKGNLAGPKGVLTWMYQLPKRNRKHPDYKSTTEALENFSK